MNEHSFYVTLLSNSSAQYFPNNSTANFFTKLPKTVKLEGEWVVGLVEFHFPCTMLNVREHENVVYIKKNRFMAQDKSMVSVEYKSHIPATNYDKIDHVLKALNENPLLNKDVVFRHDDISKRVVVTNNNKNITSICTTTTLSLQLGFEPNTNFIKTMYGKYPVNLHLGLPSQIFIYTDIIQPQVVGDVITPLLRIIPLDPTLYIYGAYRMNAFSPAHYVSVMRREFDVIEIDIRTSTGEKVPFQFGISSIKLHFKRVN